MFIDSNELNSVTAIVFLCVLSVFVHHDRRLFGWQIIHHPRRLANSVHNTLSQIHDSSDEHSDAYVAN